MANPRRTDFARETGFWGGSQSQFVIPIQEGGYFNGKRTSARHGDYGWRTQPEPELKLILERLRLELDWQPWLVYFLGVLSEQKLRLAKKFARERILLGDLPELSVRAIGADS
ncbi:MAG: hypothetical protein M3O41_13985 [Pseudomonadota bacterium]|nr:hypothetical protein [Pseudomonadota bacterium]